MRHIFYKISLLQKSQVLLILVQDCRQYLVILGFFYKSVRVDELRVAIVAWLWRNSRSVDRGARNTKYRVLVIIELPECEKLLQMQHETKQSSQIHLFCTKKNEAENRPRTLSMLVDFKAMTFHNDLRSFSRHATLFIKTRRLGKWNSFEQRVKKSPAK